MIDGRAWKYRVVRRGRGMAGQWFDYGTAATFREERDARAYAEAWARELTVYATIDVRARRGNRTIAIYRSLRD